MDANSGDSNENIYVDADARSYYTFSNNLISGGYVGLMNGEDLGTERQSEAQMGMSLYQQREIRHSSEFEKMS